MASAPRPFDPPADHGPDDPAPPAQPQGLPDQAFAQVADPRRDVAGTFQGLVPGRASPDHHPTGEPQTASDASVKASRELPHERDQHPDMTGEVRHPDIEQAAQDLKAGRQDTSRSPEMDQAYKKVIGEEPVSPDEAGGARPPGEVVPREG